MIQKVLLLTFSIPLLEVGNILKNRSLITNKRFMFLEIIKSLIRENLIDEPYSPVDKPEKVSQNSIDWK